MVQTVRSPLAHPYYHYKQEGWLRMPGKDNMWCKQLQLLCRLKRSVVVCWTTHFLHILACKKVMPSNIGCETPYNPSIWCPMIQNTMMGKHLSQPISHIPQLVSPTICYLADSDYNPKGFKGLSNPRHGVIYYQYRNVWGKNNWVLFPQDLVCSVQVQGVTLQVK